jgi:hypothetical protein
MTINNRLYNANGELSRYGLACGYIGQTIYGSVEVTMYHDSAVYQVRVSDYDSPTPRLVWESVESLTQARALYRKYKRKYKPAKSA